MAEILFEKGRVISLGAISKEGDLKQPGRIVINGPPTDGSCDVCGRHIRELKPFGGPGDPLVGDFSGALLIKRWRAEGPYNEAAEKAWKEAEKEVPEKNGLLPWFISRFGEEEGNRLYWSAHAYDSVGKSWECRDCACLDGDEYWETIKKKWERKQEQIDGRIGCSGEDD